MDSLNSLGESLGEWMGEHSNSKNALVFYGVGAGLCVLVYGMRKGIRGLRQYHIEKEEKPDKVEAETAMDRVLFESLKGCAEGIIPSLFWPAHLGAYVIVKWKEEEIVKQVRKELAAKKKD